MTADTYPFNYVEPAGPLERQAGRWREAPEGGSKFQLVKYPPLPGKCASCGYSGGTDGVTSQYERMFVDLSFDVDFYGTVVFCTTCVIEIGSVLGFVPPEAHQNIVDNLVELTVKYQEARLANDQLRSTIHLLTGDSDSVSSSVEDIPGKSTDNGNTATDEHFNADETSGTESSAGESSSVKGRADISSTTGGRDNNDGLDI